MSSKSQDTRQRILDATWKLMQHGGGRSVRMSDIAQAAGLSRQALYLHFAARADLLIALTRHMDDVLGVEALLRPSRDAASGVERLRAYIEAWGTYLPEIQGVVRALLAMQETDAEAKAAWSDRMNAMRHGCKAAIKALKAEDRLADGWNVETATDLLWTILGFEGWDQLTNQCEWETRDYIVHMQHLAERSFVRPDAG